MFITKPKRSTQSRGAAVLAVAAMAMGAIMWTGAASAALPSQGYADLVEKVSPAVVFISSFHKAQKPKAEANRPDWLPFEFGPNSPFKDFFKQFQNGRHIYRGPSTALGSGFIIDPAGYIVTNDHVIDGASKIKVKLQDGRKFTAKIVGTDKKTDLALLKISAKTELPYVKFGDSSKLRPGDVVLAVGNPFGLGGTVTAGIVSARNRDINAGPYDDYIQTDAAINRGNSGGPLFNTNGNVVGVNTAIYSPNGGSVGIGFAIPSNLVKNITGQLRDHGNVRRGWLGVKIQTVSPEIAQSLGLDAAHGALVAEVTPDSPAAKAHLRQGDVILGYEGKTIKKMRDLPSLVAATRAGTVAKLKLWRNGRKMSVSVRIGKLTPERVASAQPRPQIPGRATSKYLGAKLAALNDAARAKLNLPDDMKGVVISEVDPDGHAASAGLQPGDVIEKVGSITVRRPADVDRAFAKSNKSAVLLLINRNGKDLFVGVKRALA